MKLLVLFITITLSTASFAANNSAQSLVESGLEAYSKNGARAAIKAWIIGSGLEGSKDALSQANTLKQIEDFYGAFEGSEIVKTHSISNKSAMILFVMHYNKGITYSRFQTYKTKTGQWVATEFKFHTEASQVWPTSDVFGEK